MKKHYGESIDKVVKSNDTISRKQAIETLIAKANAEGAYGYLDAKSIKDCLTSMPSAEPERKTGKWIDDTYCSECGWVHTVEPGFIGSVEGFSYCPNCGSYNGGDVE